jgi:sirohydrochlorin cobaltochelatase
LLVSHGTRSRRGAEEFRALAEVVARQVPEVSVQPAFLELTEPTIEQGVARLVERGAQRIVIVPLLLFAAGHAKRDVPAAVETAVKDLNAGHLTLQYARHLGCAEPIVELSRQRFTESLHGRPDVAAARTCLLLVGRGSRDDAATAEMHEFARLRAEKAPVGGTAVAFLAMARPAVQDVLPQLAARDWRRIVVQPHLLFHGELYDELCEQFATVAAANRHQDWIVSGYLAQGIGPEDSAGPLQAGAILQRFHEAAIRVVVPGADG